MRSASLFISSGDPLLDRRFEWADGLLARGEADAAAKLLEETLARAPGFVAGWFLLAGAREQAGDRGGAIEAYRRTLALDPADRLGTALRLARLGEGDGLGAMTGAYVRTLFDQYAPRFDRELRDALHYRGPDLLRAAIDETCGRDRRFHRVLDLGCGTGLMGEAVRKRADELVGVDLSPAMLAIAERKKIYDALNAGDLISFLGADPRLFDLILAADVFVYLDDLSPVLQMAASRLAAGGAIAFSIETHPGDGVILRDTLRFAHGEPHLRAVAAEASLVVSYLAKASTRMEKNAPVAGLVAVLRNGAQS
ncbi:MAG TPA: methyltransferase [Xanthobacteraceae bacterium]|nr:methyltransferase [Xanthobacteraceae bacterium]